MTNREQAPPGWKRRLYGRQDARRYGGRARGGDTGMVGRAVLCPPPPANEHYWIGYGGNCKWKYLDLPRRRARSDAPYRLRCQAGTG